MNIVFYSKDTNQYLIGFCDCSISEAYSYYLEYASAKFFPPLDKVRVEFEER